MFELVKRGVARALGVWQAIVGGVFTAGQSVYPPTSTTDFIRLYQSDPWIFSSVLMIATAAGRAPVRIAKADGTRIGDHKLLDLLARPNPRQTKRMFMEAVFNYLETAGEVFIELVPNDLGTIEEMYVMRPDRVEIVPTLDARVVDRYIYRVGAASIEIPSELVVPINYFNPLSDWRGQSTLKVLSNSIVMDRAADGWLTRFMKRYGAKEGYLHTDLPGVGEQESKRLSKKWQDRFSDIDHTPILPRGLKYESYAEAPKQGGAMDVDDVTVQRKIAALNIPPAKLGMLSYAKYSNYDLQTRAFLLDTVWPKLDRLADAYNLFLLPKFPTLAGCSVEFYMNPTVFIDMLAAMKELTQLFDRDALTVNELIEITGLGRAFPDGDARCSDLKKAVLAMSTRSAEAQNKDAAQ